MLNDTTVMINGKWGKHKSNKKKQQANDYTP